MRQLIAVPVLLVVAWALTAVEPKIALMAVASTLALLAWLGVATALMLD
jgi:hypothetical protein